jgi:hypothetical protein
VQCPVGRARHDRGQRHRGPIRKHDHVATPRHRADEIAAGIAQRTTNFRNALRERIVGDSHARPIDLQQFVLRDDPPCIGREVPQHAE